LLASRLLGWTTVCAVEKDTYCQRVLQQRQLDGLLDAFPIWDDICTFDGFPWRGAVDVVSGGFPCQDISSAGRGAGLAGSRSGLWYEMLRVIGEVRPQFIFAENSPYLRKRGLGTVIAGLTGLGYDVRWGVLGAWHVGAPHRRNRMWVLANSNRTAVRQQPGRGRGQDGEEETEPREEDWWSEPRFAGMDDGVANRMDRIRATGNGQVPAVAALAWGLLSRWDGCNVGKEQRTSGG
jgi:DNA (cytosine-5)-methyltransferase 1